MSNEFLDYVEDIIEAMEVVTQEIPKVKPHLRQILADYGATWPPEPEGSA